MKPKWAYVYLILFSAVMLLSAPVLPQATRSDSAGGDISPSVYLRSQLVQFLGGGSVSGAGQSDNPLSSLDGVSCFAITTYLLFEQDESVLNRLYPSLRERVLRTFEAEDSPSGGFVVGSIRGVPEGDAHLSPAANALANIELHALSLIAERIGLYEEALELTAWSRALSDRVTHTFFDPAREGFFPIAQSGRFLTRFAPEQLLPLLLDRQIGEAMRDRVVETFIRHTRDDADGSIPPQGFGGPSSEPTAHPLLYDLLSVTPSIDGERLALIAPPRPSSAAVGRTNPAGQWAEFWRRNPRATTRLFPPREAIQGLIILSKIFARESLLIPGDDRRFAADVDSLERALAAESADLATHKQRIATVNRLLASVSNLQRYLEADSRLWKVIDETRWRALSPRTRKLITSSCRLALDELLYAKLVLSGSFTRSTGITAGATVPEGPVPLGKGIEVEATITSRIDSLELSGAYVQIGDTRWNLTAEQERRAISPWTTPITVRRSLPIHPKTEPGLVSFPVVFDFKHDGSRVELHHRLSICFITGHQANVYFPEGRVLRNTPIPVKIVLQHRSERDVQGILQGTFLKDIRCNPALPARYAVQAGTAATTLPIEITCSEKAPPGVYPVTFYLELGGEPIAVFEETVVRPLRWLYIGALPNNGITAENALYYQDNLFEEHATEDGRILRWRELSAKTVDGSGKIVLERIRGSAPNSGVLLYTTIDAPGPLKAIWHLDTRNSSSVWINGDLVFSSDRSDAEASSGLIALREGANSFLIALRWRDEPLPVSFHLSDRSGLPVPGIGNEFERLIDGYYRLAGAAGRGGSALPPEMQLTVVTLTLNYPSAEDVCVVGSFNNWEAGANPMRRSGNGLWSAKVSLPAGRYAYKFLIDRTTKIADPASSTIEPDGFGGFNSILSVE